MSRPLRIEYAGAWYHTMNRGRRGEAIFLSDSDRREFLKVLRETIALWNLRVSAYCLMSNHYHLLVQTPDGNLARAMRHINGVYTQRFNRRHNTDGQLFRGRYKAVLVEDDGHLLEVLRYIHRNPLKAGIAKTLADYPWSSHMGYLSRAKKWAWLEKEKLLSMLATTKSRQKSAYLDFISAGEPEEIEEFYSLKNLPSILGNKPFIEKIREKFSGLLDNTDIPESKALAPDPEEVVSAVCGHYGIPREKLFGSRRGNTNIPRDVAIYLVRYMCRITLPAVGEVFGIKNYSTVSSAVQRMRTRLPDDARLKEQIETIRKKVVKSQKQT